MRRVVRRPRAAHAWAGELSVCLGTHRCKKSAQSSQIRPFGTYSTNFEQILPRCEAHVSKQRSTNNLFDCSLPEGPPDMDIENAQTHHAHTPAGAVDTDTSVRWPPNVEKVGQSFAQFGQASARGRRVLIKLGQIWSKLMASVQRRVQTCSGSCMVLRKFASVVRRLVRRKRTQFDVCRPWSEKSRPLPELGGSQPEVAPGSTLWCSISCRNESCASFEADGCATDRPSLCCWAANSGTEEHSDTHTTHNRHG